LFASGIFSNQQIEPADCPQKENPRHGGTYSGSDGEQNLHVQRTKAWPQSSRCGALSVCNAASSELRRKNKAGGVNRRMVGAGSDGASPKQRCYPRKAILFQQLIGLGEEPMVSRRFLSYDWIAGAFLGGNRMELRDVRTDLKSIRTDLAIDGGTAEQGHPSASCQSSQRTDTASWVATDFLTGSLS
jgi:hypothetical protein